MFYMVKYKSLDDLVTNPTLYKQVDKIIKPIDDAIAYITRFSEDNQGAFALLSSREEPIYALDTRSGIEYKNSLRKVAIDVHVEDMVKALSDVFNEVTKGNGTLGRITISDDTCGNPGLTLYEGVGGKHLSVSMGKFFTDKIFARSVKTFGDLLDALELRIGNIKSIVIQNKDVIPVHHKTISDVFICSRRLLDNDWVFYMSYSFSKGGVVYAVM